MITELWVFIVKDPQGDEGIMLNSADDGLPMIAFNLEGLERFRKDATYLAERTGSTFSTARFVRTDNLEGKS